MANYHRIYKCDVSNGEGVRVTLFLSGCIHACPGCYNVSTWNPKSGLELTDEIIERMLDDCHNHDGLSLSGGDPLHLRNRGTVLDVCTRFKSRYPEKNIWIWTGFKYEDVQDDPIVNRIFELVDVVIDGKYEKDNPTQKPWRGSDNQRLIKVKEL